MFGDARASARAAEAAAAIDLRFGWLKKRLIAFSGNVQALKPHEQVLWYGRQKVVQQFNVIGQWRDLGKRERAYQKLVKELAR